MTYLEVWRGRPNISYNKSGVIPTNAPDHLLPFAPKDKMEWTEDHYVLYNHWEVIIGNKKVLTREEIEQAEIAEKAFETAANGNFKEALAMLGEEVETPLEWFDEPEYLSELEKKLQRDNGLIK